jgi:hypothetical protein
VLIVGRRGEFVDVEGVARKKMTNQKVGVG